MNSENVSEKILIVFQFLYKGIHIAILFQLEIQRV